MRGRIGTSLATARLLIAVTLGLWAPLATAPAAAQEVDIARAQAEVQSVVEPLINSEAETAAGSYVPGVGAVFSLELVRGPNAVDGIPYASVRDWLFYLMTTFGPKLDAVPKSETIAMVVTYYDYDADAFHTMTVTCPAAAIGNPAHYSVWLDDAPYDQAVAILTGKTIPIRTPASATATPSQPAEPTSTPLPAGPTPTPVPASHVSLTETFATPASLDDWNSVSGSWRLGEGSYDQTDTGLFDLVTYYVKPVLGDYQFSADVRFVDGQMGAGLVFNAPSDSSKRGAQMVSFAGNGTYLQWGYYDVDGVFKFEGGVAVSPPASDGAWHALSIVVTGGTFTLSLDGAVVDSAIPMIQPAGGYLGLLDSTSAVSFDNVTIESVGK